MDSRLWDAGRRISLLIQGAGGRALAVGGSVRDELLGLEAKDLDLEVYALQPRPLEKLLRRHFGVSLIGRSFGVLKVFTPELDEPIDVSIPRRERKIGSGHKGFEIHSDPFMTPREAARRRDLTINAIARDLLTGEIVDPFDGRADLRRRLLRAVDQHTFVEDPLRVLRVAQFAARFRFRVAPDLIRLCHSIDLSELPRERIFGEFRKLLLKGVKPALGLNFLRRADQLRQFPEIQALLGVPQDPKWHPEGDVFTHTLMALNAAAAERTGDDREDLLVALSVLCHDLGKPATTERIDGRIRSYGHAEAGEAPTRTLLDRLTNEVKLIEQVVLLVRYHLEPVMLFQNAATDRAVRRLARKVNIARLVRVARADQLGRTTPQARAGEFPGGDWLLAKAKDLAVETKPPRPILLGRHLIERGLAPGPRFGKLLQRAYEAQLDGQVKTPEEALALLGL